MTYAVVQDVSASWEQYDTLRRALATDLPDGLVLHVAGPTEEGFRIIAIWESEEAAERFRVRVEDAWRVAVPPVYRPLLPEHVVLGRTEGLS
jgi:hypothetical protein